MFIMFAMPRDETPRPHPLEFVAGVGEGIERLWMGTYWDTSDHAES